LNWRFIPYAQFDGATNMALDVALLEQAEDNPPVLRLYGFAPPCMSIGLAQRLPPDCVARIEERGFEIVRRPSGGRAVLHYHDITYAFIASQTGTGKYGLLQHSVSAAYRQICEGLKEAFLLLGLAVELGPAAAAYRHLADCFLATTNADLHFAGRKLAGSAQLRRRGCVLQHGSIPLNLDQELVPTLLGAEPREPRTAKTKEDRHANLFEMLGHELSISELNEALQQGFSRAFNVSFDSQPLSEREIELAELARNDYVFSAERTLNA
jgi:lipoate-protein ligase A